MAKLRYALWALVFVMGIGLAYATMTWTLNRTSGNSLAAIDIGGPFEALGTDGKAITHDTMKGRPHLVFFGFTNCPDVCPTSLYETGQWLSSLGDDGNKIDAYFVSVDPARDTPEQMGDYLSAFDKRIKGITGSEEQITDLLAKWRVFAQKVPLEDDDYTMNHTATTYLMKSDGSFFGTIAYGENIDTAKRKLERLLQAEG
ncbi:MAG: SCO family protein [Pseudomonadota bacterium]